MSTPAANAAATKAATITFHFKAFALGKDGQKKLAALLEAGKLAEDDIVVTPATEDTVEKWKRKSVAVETTIPVIAIEGFTAEQNAHVEYLITKQLESKNKENIDTVSGQWVQWDAMLQAPPLMRSTAVKVTVEQIAAVTAVIKEWMLEAGYPEPAVNLTEALCTKKFSATECRKVKLPVLEKVESIITSWFTEMSEDEETKALLEPVVTLWTDTIGKVLRPEQSEVSEDMFEL